MHQFSNNAFNFVDKTATVGENVKIWHFAVVLAEVEIGDDVVIGSRCEIGRGCRIGKGARIGSGVFLPPNAVIGEYAFIGPNSTFCDDRTPFAGNDRYTAEPPVLEAHCSVGAGVTVLPGVRIGTKSLIGAGAVITKDVPAGAVIRGEPARVRRSLNFDIYAEPLRSKMMEEVPLNETHLLPV